MFSQTCHPSPVTRHLTFTNAFRSNGSLEKYTRRLFPLSITCSQLIFQTPLPASRGIGIFPIHSWPPAEENAKNRPLPPLGPTTSPLTLATPQPSSFTAARTFTSVPSGVDGT